MYSRKTLDNMCYRKLARKIDLLIDLHREQYRGFKRSRRREDCKAQRVFLAEMNRTERKLMVLIAEEKRRGM